MQTSNSLFRRLASRKASAALGALCAIIGHARAQYQTGFENVTASPSGTILTGQDNYTLPAASVDYLAYPYAGNTLGVPVNPFGRTQFVAGAPMSATVFARAERTLSYAC